MIEQIGDIWKAQKENDWICITTNGNIKKDGRLVMGKGIALEAATKFPTLPYFLAEKVKSHGNLPFMFNEFNLISFPTKNNWWEDSDPKLIENSCLLIAKMEDRFAFSSSRILIPRPGCNNGNLSYMKVVRPILIKAFSHYEPEDKFIIFSKN